MFHNCNASITLVITFVAKKKEKNLSKTSHHQNTKLCLLQLWFNAQSVSRNARYHHKGAANIPLKFKDIISARPSPVTVATFWAHLGGTSRCAFYRAGRASLVLMKYLHGRLNPSLIKLKSHHQCLIILDTSRRPRRSRSFPALLLSRPCSPSTPAVPSPPLHQGCCIVCSEMETECFSAHAGLPRGNHRYIIRTRTLSASTSSSSASSSISTSSWLLHLMAFWQHDYRYAILFFFVLHVLTSVTSVLTSGCRLRYHTWPSWRLKVRALSDMIDNDASRPNVLHHWVPITPFTGESPRDANLQPHVSSFIGCQREVSCPITLRKRETLFQIMSCWMSSNSGRTKRRMTFMDMWIKDFK